MFTLIIVFVIYHARKSILSVNVFIEKLTEVKFGKLLVSIVRSIWKKLVRRIVDGIKNTRKKYVFISVQNEIRIAKPSSLAA